MEDSNRVPLDWDSIDDPAWQATPATGPEIPLAPQKNWLRGQCGQIFACACATGGGFALSHTGCAVSFAMAFSSFGLTTGFSASTAALTLTTAASAAGVALWYKLRGKMAGAWERAITVGGAATGIALSLSMHLGGPDNHFEVADKAKEYYQSLDPENQKWFLETPERRELLRAMADSLCRADTPDQAPVSSQSPLFTPRPDLP